MKGVRGTRLTTIPGAPPNLEHPPKGCAFAPRCAYTVQECLERVPEPRSPVPGRAARCVRVAA